jgi:hypothetical protein
MVDAGGTDDEVCEAYDWMLTSLNGPGQANLRLAVSGYICARRPHLAEELLEAPVHIAWEHGIKDADDVVAWAEGLGQDSYLAGMAGAEGILWLREGLPTIRPMLGRLLWDACVFRLLTSFGT